MSPSDCSVPFFSSLTRLSPTLTNPEGGEQKATPKWARSPIATSSSSKESNLKTALLSTSPKKRLFSTENKENRIQNQLKIQYIKTNNIVIKSFQSEENKWKVEAYPLGADNPFDNFTLPYSQPSSLTATAQGRPDAPVAIWEKSCVYRPLLNLVDENYLTIKENPPSDLCCNSLPQVTSVIRYVQIEDGKESFRMIQWPLQAIKKVFSCEDIFLTLVKSKATLPSSEASWTLQAYKAQQCLWQKQLSKHPIIQLTSDKTVMIYEKSPSDHEADGKTVRFFNIETGVEKKERQIKALALHTNRYDELHVDEKYSCFYQLFYTANKAEGSLDRNLITGLIEQNQFVKKMFQKDILGIFLPLSAYLGFYNSNYKTLELFNALGQQKKINDCLSALARDNQLLLLRTSVGTQNCQLEKYEFVETEELIQLKSQLALTKPIEDPIQQAALVALGDPEKVILFSSSSCKTENDWSSISFIDLKSQKISSHSLFVMLDQRWHIDLQSAKAYTWNTFHQSFFIYTENEARLFRNDYRVKRLLFGETTNSSDGFELPTFHLSS